MTEPRRWDAPQTTNARALERLVAGRCPAPGELMLAVAAEFRAVDEGAVSFRLDELARPLFGITGDARAISLRLAELMTDEQQFGGDESATEGLLLDRVLERRAGHPLALAVLAAEIGRRAGVAVGVCSTPGGWYAGLAERDQLWLIDPATDSRPRPSGPVRAHCGHEIAYAALTGLHARLLRDGDGPAAERAARLRRRLPVERHGPS
jgi:regulator of sirC expression with transglutaminase-like and TPR domain